MFNANHTLVGLVLNMSPENISAERHGAGNIYIITCLTFT